MPKLCIYGRGANFNVKRVILGQSAILGQWVIMGHVFTQIDDRHNLAS